MFDGTRVISASAPIPFRFFPPVKAGGSTVLHQVQSLIRRTRLPEGAKEVGETILRLECPLKDNEFEIVAFAMLKDGRQIQSSANTAQDNPSLKEITFGAWPEDIKEYRVEFVPFYWCEFRDVSLKPKSTSAKVAPGFGPVIERALLGFNESHTNCFIDLDNGKLIDPPATLALTNRAAVWDWAARVGVDAVAMTTQRTRGMLGYELVAGQLRDEDWETGAPGQVSTALVKAQFENMKFPGQDPLAQSVSPSTPFRRERTSRGLTRSARGKANLRNLQFLSYTDRTARQREDPLLGSCNARKPADS